MGGNSYVRVWTGVLLVSTTGCFTHGTIACRTDPITGSQQCQLVGGSSLGGLFTVLAAAAAYAVVGCTLNGCPLPDVCNPNTKRCETSRCSETRTCPNGYRCDLSTKLCR